MNQNEDYDELEALARRGRWLAVSTVAKSGAGHVGGPFSAMDLLIALYFRVMKGRSRKPALAGAGSIHSFERPFVHRTTHGNGAARFSTDRRTQDV
jgi:hypothetical protein